MEETAHAFYASSRFLDHFSLAKFREIWTQFLELDAGVIFAADSDGEIVGVIGGLVHPEIYGNGIVAEEFFWFVRPEFRGAGVRLYRRFEQWARSRGAGEIQMVHLFDSMPEKVAKFYLHSGFEPVEMRYRKALTA
ncbi:MAG TPA: GNAT family N-acetyltransferase [Casimicrobiaceae bacterium]|nr:GNAT family N-acetyltransferase [Casimicrobiaceae bacterium]